MVRRGQAAMEFLMTYGWAILVVLAAIGALAYFGVLSPDRFLPDKCVFNPPLSCSEYKVTAGAAGAGTVAVGVQNNAGVSLSEINITLTSADCGAATTTMGLDGTSARYSNVTVENGAQVGGALLTWTCANALTNSDRFQGDFAVIYQKAGEVSSHDSSGSIQGRVE